MHRTSAATASSISAIPPAMPPGDTAPAVRAPILHTRRTEDAIPMLSATFNGSPLLAMPPDVLHLIVIELRKTDSTVRGLREVEYLRATGKQLRNRIPRPIPEGLMGAVEFNDMGALKRLLAASRPHGVGLAQELRRSSPLVMYSYLDMDTQAYTLMQAAVRLGHVEMVTVLAESSAAHAGHDEFMAGGLLRAIQCGDIGAAEILIAAGAKAAQARCGGVSLLPDAIQGGRAMLVRLLTHAGAELNPAPGQGMPPLFLAAIQGCRHIVKVLIDAGAMIDRQQQDGRTALMQTQIMGHKLAANELRLAGAKDYPVFAQVMENRADRDSPDVQVDIPMLTLAAEAGDAQLVADLIAGGADVNQISCIDDDCETTALLLAAFRGHAEVIRILLNAGALADPAGKPSRSALHTAAACGHIEAVRLLLPATAIRDIDKLDDDFRNPMITAASQGYDDIACCLLQAGANVNVDNRHGQQPLEAAALGGHAMMVKILLRYGAKQAHRDCHGMTAFDHAVEKGHHAIADLLRGLH